MALYAAFNVILLLTFSTTAPATEDDYLCLLQQPDVDSTHTIKHKTTKREELEEVRAQVKDDILKFSQLNQEKGHFTQANAKLTTEVDTLSNTNKELEKSLGDAASVLEELKKLNAQDAFENKEMEGLMPGLHKLNGDLKEALGKKEESHSALDKIEHEKADLQNLRDGLSSKHAALQTTLNQLKQKYSDTMTEGSGRRLAPLQQFLKEAREKNKLLHTNTSMAAMANQNEMSNMGDLEQSARSMSERFEEINSKVAKLRSENEELERENENIKKGMAQVHSAINGDSSPPLETTKPSKATA